MKLLAFAFWGLVIAFFLYFVGAIANHYTLKSYFLPAYSYFILFFYIVGLLAFWISTIGLKKSSESSVFIVLASVLAKLLLSMVFALIFIYGNKIDRLGFLISFFLPYFIYSTFEISTLMYNLRALKK